MMDNEAYYQAGDGAWTGSFTFEITDPRAFLAPDAKLPERMSALLLHTTLKALGKATISSAIEAPRGTLRAKGRATVVVVTSPLLRLSPLKIYSLRGYYTLDPNGRDVHVLMHEEYGPIPFLFQREIKGDAVITQDGRRAEYHIEMFGCPWVGVYDIAPGLDHVDVEYRSAWGKLTYSSDKRVQRPPSFAPPSMGAQIAIDTAKRLAERADALRRARDPMAVFTELYADVTVALSRALDDNRVHIPGARGELSFQRPAWVGALAEAFAARYLRALDAYEQGGYEPEAWRAVFATLRSRSLTEIDALALCISAHIAGDLPHALVDVMNRYPDLDPSDVARDFELVGDLLVRHIHAAQDAIGDRFASALDVLGRLTPRRHEMLFAQRLRELRALAWYNATRLRKADARDRLAVEDAILDGIEDTVSVIIDPEIPVISSALYVVRRLLGSPPEQARHPSRRSFTRDSTP